MAIDYEKILIAYINLILSNEGTTFLPDRCEGLSAAEHAALLRAAAKSHTANSEELLRRADEWERSERGDA
jgi:hypothetical protein